MLLLAFILPGCVFSLYPLYTTNDLVYDSKLEGIWGETGKQEIWKFEKQTQHSIIGNNSIEEKAYLLTFTENGEARKMQGHLTRLDDNLFLDIFPEELGSKNSLFESQFVPVHTYAKVKITGDHIELNFLNTDFLDKLLEQNTIRIKHENLDSYKIITASTDELQKFIKKYANRQELFEQPVVLTKKPK